MESTVKVYSTSNTDNHTYGFVDREQLAALSRRGYWCESGRAVGVSGPARVLRGKVFIDKLHHSKSRAKSLIKLSMHDQVSVKVVDRLHVSGKFVKETLPSALNSVQKLHYHPNIALPYDHFRTRTHSFVVAEYGGQTDVITYMKSQKHRDVAARNVFGQMLSAVDYAHDNGVTHGNLTPSSILVGKNGQVKVQDFGLPSQLVASQRLPETHRAYTPPEVMCSLKNEGKPCDIYSMGIILYEMLHGHVPYSGHRNVMFKNIQDQNIEFSTKVHRDARRLIKKMLHPDPLKRPTVQGCLDDAWVFGLPTGNGFKAQSAKNTNDEKNGPLPLLRPTSHKPTQSPRIKFEQIYRDEAQNGRSSKVGRMDGDTSPTDDPAMCRTKSPRIKQVDGVSSPTEDPTTHRTTKSAGIERADGVSSPTEDPTTHRTTKSAGIERADGVASPTEDPTTHRTTKSAGIERADGVASPTEDPTKYRTTKSARIERADGVASPTEDPTKYRTTKSARIERADVATSPTQDPDPWQTTRSARVDDDISPTEDPGAYNVAAHFAQDEGRFTPGGGDSSYETPLMTPDPIGEMVLDFIAETTTRNMIMSPQPCVEYLSSVESTPSPPRLDRRLPPSPPVATYRLQAQRDRGRILQTKAVPESTANQARNDGIHLPPIVGKGVRQSMYQEPKSFLVQVDKAPVPRVYGSRYKKKEHLSIQEQSTHARTCSNIINSARADLAIRGHSNGNMNGHVGMKMRHADACSPHDVQRSAVHRNKVVLPPLKPNRHDRLPPIQGQTTGAENKTTLKAKDAYGKRVHSNRYNT